MASVTEKEIEDVKYRAERGYKHFNYPLALAIGDVQLLLKKVNELESERLRTSCPSPLSDAKAHVEASAQMRGNQG